METYIALLRGINVGGRNRLAMADLRALLTALGHGEPRTYVQSGNAVFTSSRTDVAGLEQELAARIAADLGVGPAVLVRTAEELRTVAAANPYAEAAAVAPTTVHAAFLSAEPADRGAFAFDAGTYAPEAASTGDRVVYLHLPGGMARSPLATELAKRRAGVEATIRNWRTVTSLLDLVSA